MLMQTSTSGLASATHKSAFLVYSHLEALSATPAVLDQAILLLPFPLKGLLHVLLLWYSKFQHDDVFCCL